MQGTSGAAPMRLMVEGGFKGPLRLASRGPTAQLCSAFQWTSLSFCAVCSALSFAEKFVRMRRRRMEPPSLARIRTGILADFTGTDADDSHWGTSNADRIEGLGGRDYLLGDGGDDTILGGAGDDNLHGGDGNDLIEGGEGNDGLQGNDGVD